MRSINQAAAVRIAREAANPFGAFVAGSRGAGHGKRCPRLFPGTDRRIIESGVDLLVLETFQDLCELHQAILAAREAAGAAMPIVAHVSVEDDGTVAGRTAAGRTSLEECTKCLDQWSADVIGLNCSSGPGVILESIQKMSAWTRKPLSAMPNAGLPQALTPGQMAAYTEPLLRAGARILGRLLRDHPGAHPADSRGSGQGETVSGALH